MDMAWRAMIPMSLGLLLATALVIYFLGDTPRAFMRINGRMALALLGTNVVVLGLSFLISRLIPAGPDTNRKVSIEGSRFTRTPLPGSPVVAPPHAQHPHGDTGLAGAMTGGAVGT
jgi:hypothetical protein